MTDEERKTLVEALKDILAEDSLHNAEEFLDALRATLSNHGYKIVKEKAGD